jgi:hypothetical protein
MPENTSGGHSDGADPSEALLVLEALKRFEQGDFSVKLDPKGEMEGVYGEIAEVFNRIVDSSSNMCQELERVHVAVGSQGDFNQHIYLEAKGSWGSCIDSANHLVDNIMLPMIVVRDAIGATAHGDLVSALDLLQNTEVPSPKPCEGLAPATVTFFPSYLGAVMVFGILLLLRVVHRVACPLPFSSTLCVSAVFLLLLLPGNIGEYFARGKFKPA